MTPSRRAAAPRRRARPKAAVAAIPPPDGEFSLPGSARKHPALGLGLWALGRWRAEDEARTKATIARALELGIRWFDTAEVYGAGRSERLLGDVLQHTAPAGSQAYVVTKVSWEHLRPTQIRAALINSLERLGRRSVDLYLVHAPDPKVPLADTMGTLEALWKDGKIGAIGVSNFSVEQLEEAARHLAEAKIAVNQVRYSLLDQEEAGPVAAYCRDRGILIEAYTPVARGILAGRYLDGSRVPPEVRRFAQDLFGESRLDTVRERARRIQDLAAEEGFPILAVALRWLAGKGAAPVLGASRPPQVEEALRAWASRPSERLLARAEAIARGDRA